MQIVEHNQDKLVLYFHRSLGKGLLVGMSFVLAGIFFCLIGLLLIQQAEGAGIMSSGMGMALVIGGIFWIIKFPKVSTFTFDKSRNCLLWEQQILPSQGVKQSLEIPLDLISGVEITTSGDTETTLYYPKLILDRVYWRIHLHSHGSYERAVAIAKTVSQFLNVNYFPDESQAPLPVWQQKANSQAAPYQFHWQYLEAESDRLQQHLSQYPLDAEAHQELGILVRAKPKESIVHLQQAENLFVAQQEVEGAVLARVLQGLVRWKH
jgi:hypothetical protein